MTNEWNSPPVMIKTKGDTVPGLMKSIYISKTDTNTYTRLMLTLARTRTVTPMLIPYGPRDGVKKRGFRAVFRTNDFLWIKNDDTSCISLLYV